MKIQNANQLRGRAIGAIFFACFGTGWIFPTLPRWRQSSASMRPPLQRQLQAWWCCCCAAGVPDAPGAELWPRVPDDPARGRAFRVDQCDSMDCDCDCCILVCQVSHRRLHHFGHHGHRGNASVSAGAVVSLPDALFDWGIVGGLGSGKRGVVAGGGDARLNRVGNRRDSVGDCGGFAGDCVGGGA